MGLARFIEGSMDAGPRSEELRKSVRRIGGLVLAAIGTAVLIAALIAGLWYFLRGRREQQTPETPQTTTLRTLHHFPPLLASMRVAH